MKKTILLIISVLAVSIVTAQSPRKDKVIFKEYQPGYYQNYILKGIEEFNNKSEQPKTERRFKMDFSGINLPTDIDLYKKYWYNEPVSQGNTGTCWCFSSTSFLESEIFRQTGQKIKLSEMYTVYWEYVEKAKYFIKTRGASAFAEGSEANAVTRMWKIYGVVPLEAYNGMLPGQTYHNHSKMFEEMESCLKSLKTSNAWNEELAINTIKSIMNSYMGIPPAKVTINGKEMTPQEYL
ncbi:MAG: C1 family peptidase, partial [Bacteroidales bacterium]